MHGHTNIKFTSTYTVMAFLEMITKYNKINRQWSEQQNTLEIFRNKNNCYSM